MPRFTHPLWWRLQQPDPFGPVRMVIRADVMVEFRNAAGDWVSIECLVDTGASFSVLSTDKARELGLAVPPTTSRVTLDTADGKTVAVVRDGVFAFRFAKLPEVTFELLWLLRDDIPAEVGPVLGLHNTLDLMTLVFDGPPRPGAPMGYLEVITRPG